MAPGARGCPVASSFSKNGDARRFGWQITSQTDGLGIRRWKPWTVTAIARAIIKSTVFLYPSIEEARRGSRRGGTGFLVCVPFETNSNLAHIYGVSCAHVIWGNSGQGSPVVKLNKKKGDPKILDLRPERWAAHEAAPDIAVCLLGEIDDDDDIVPIDISALITRDGLAGKGVRDEKLEIGDEVVMPGRLMGVPDGDRVRPVMRFGNLAQMPDDIAPISSNVAAAQVSFLVEMRSRTGFSGSPVFGYYQASPLRMELDSKLTMISGFSTPRLIGVEWGQVGFDDAADEADESVSGWRASSMLGVVPAWYLYELLMGDGSLIEQRKVAEREHAEGAAAQGESSGEPPTTEENPSHREDFSRLLGAAVRGPREADGT